MKTIRTYKLKLSTENTKFQEVATNYKAAANWLSMIVYNSKIIRNSISLQKEFYGSVREKFQLPSQVTCSLFRHVTGTYKTMRANKQWSLAVYRKDVVPLGWKRDFNWTRNHLTIWSEATSFQCRDLPEGTWKDSKLKLIENQWYLLLTVEITIPEPKTTGTIVGVDSGQKNLLTAVDRKSNKTLYISGSALNHKRLCLRRTKAKVASVGSSSARRLLKRLSGREKAVTHQLLHVASKQLVAFAESVGAKVIVMEDLTGIRKSKKMHHKQRARNHRWPFAQCQFFISYKAAAKGIGIELVDPAYTSKSCGICGHTEAANRNGLKFLCKSCGKQDNADRNGAINIASRSLLLWGNPGKERAVSQPAYSSNEGIVQLAAIPYPCGRGS
jgi:IS605 OrfB family transposase